MKLRHLTLLLLITSCSTTIRNFDDYQKQFLPKTTYMPSRESIAGKAPKIVVFALDDNNNEIATQSSLSNSLANNVENILSKNRLGEIVDRKAATKLQKEIALSEMNKTGSYKGPVIADYAVSGAISNAGFTSKYSNGSTYFNPQSKQMVSVPPKYTYTSDVAGNLKIYELPSLAVVGSIEFNAKKSRSEAVQQDGGFALGGIQIGGKKVDGSKRDDSLVRKAGEEAISDIEVDIKNFFAKKGYILEKRILENKAIFKISLGSEDGLRQEDKLEVSGQYENENALTNQVEIEHRIITNATVADHIEPKVSWIVISDAKKIDSIRLGDTVKLKYKKSRFAGVTKLAISMLEQ